MTRHPEVAVIMTAYDAERTIEASVRSALAQTYDGPYRVIVVDDGSADRTVDVLRGLHDHRLTVVERERLGRARALNVALDAAHGAAYVANLDADDLMLPDRLHVQVAALEAAPSVGVVGSAYYEVHQSAAGGLDRVFAVRPPVDAETMRRQMAVGFPICHSCATFRRDLAVQLGGYDGRLRARIDFDLWLRMAVAGHGVANVPDLLGVHVKRTGTYFDGQFKVLRSAAQMARLNLIAARRLDLGAAGYAKAAARLAYSLQRRTSVKATPRFSDPVSTLPVELVALGLAGGAPAAGATAAGAPAAGATAPARPEEWSRDATG